jgi:Kdo2-lipid IVA lauroyltransferase/acyltransferase
VHSVQDSIEWLGYRVLGRAARSLPPARAHAFAARGADAFLRVASRWRAIARVNLCVAFPDASEAERSDLLRASCHHFARNLVDLARSELWLAEDFLAHVSLHHLHHVEKVLAEGRGVIALMPHMGAFELAMRCAPLAGLPLAVVVRPLRNRRLEADLARDRSRTGAQLIPHRGAAAPMLRALRRGQPLAVLNDQYERRSHGVWAPFFGVRCSTSPGVAALALRTGSAVVPAHVVRDAPDHHRLIFGPEIPAPAHGPGAVAAFAAAHNAALEATIRAHPEQWLWGHRRFRHSPDLPPDPYAHV